ncbi:MAG: rhomboid family intramembrane serine protease [Planctomycetota bacterium]|nr:rhomboid family intramembrane serine protease [Planctomycetota bacterium]
MGISERDYGRFTPTRGGQFGRGLSSGGGMGRPGFSVTTWIIIACVAVFVIDGFLQRYATLVETGSYFVAQGDETWVEVQGNPLHSMPDRPEQTELGQQLISQTIQVRSHDDSLEQETVVGLPVLRNGQTVAIAIVTPMTPLQSWLHFSTKKVIGGAQLWRLVGFQFLHADMTHLLFNMIALFFFGPLVERFLGGKRYLAFYLLCGVFGSLLYLCLNMLGWLWISQLGLPEIPGLLFNATGVPLIGASAGVFGVIIGGALLQPNAKVLLFFLIPMRLSTLAIGLIALSIIFILFGLDNAGGEAAHLGGAMAGWYFIRRPEKLHGLFNFFGRVDPTSKHFAMKGGSRVRPRGTDERQVDRILDKVSREGLQSLTKKEKRTLAEASRRGRSAR